MVDVTSDPSVSQSPAPASTGGGLMGMLGGLLKSADPTFLMSMGAGLMSGARYGSNAGEGLLQGLSMYQSQKQSQQQRQLWQQQLQMNQMDIQRRQGLMSMLPQLLGTQGSSPGPPSGGSGSATSAPQPAVAPQATGGAPMVMSQPAASSYMTPPTAGDISAIPVNGVTPRLAGAYNIYSDKLPSEGAQQMLEQQRELAKQQFAPAMAQLQGVTQSDSPTRDVKASPVLQQTWTHYAAARGLDPQKDFTDANVRQVMGGVYNAYATQLGLPTSAPAVPLKTSTDQYGRTVQTEPGTGKETVVPSPELQSVIGSNGQPTLVPKDKAVGMTPFNPTIFGAGQMTDQSREMAYQYYLQHQALPTGFARSPVMQADMMNYIASRAKQDGNTQASILATKQQVQASQSVVKDFSSGQTAKTINGLNTAISHMDQLDKAAGALGNGDVRALNSMSNFFKTQFGSSAPTNFSVIKNFASGEVAKAVLPGGGGEAERQEIADAIKNSSSPQQLHNAVQSWRNLLAGKTEALRNQWDVGTSGNQGSFDKFLLPATKKALGIPDESSPNTGPRGVLQPGQSHSVGGFTITRVN